MLNLLKRRSFAHGIHPPSRKERTHTLPIRRLPFAPRLYVPLAQHIGEPAVPIVRPGQEVVRGEPIARANGVMSIPMHAPATGVIERIGLVPTARGAETEAIILKVYAGDDQRVRYGAPRDVDALAPEELIAAIQDTGMVGLGGAAFPTHVKLSVPEGHAVDTLVVNGCECEPYLTTDHRVMLEWVDDLIDGTRFAMLACGAPRAVIGVEDNKLDAVAAIRRQLPANGRITVEAVKTKYPQGSEKLLITVLLGREVPSGGFPYQVGAVVQNIATLAQLGRLLPNRHGLIERVVTISGAGVERPGNYLVPIGTPLGFVLEQAGFAGEAGELILGGPMMGTDVASLDVPVTKAVSGILAQLPGQRTSAASRVYPCIQCGECLKACPMNLNPSRLALLAARREYETMTTRYHLSDCFECGCCAYVCPANIPLVQYFRIAKSVLREKAA